MGFSTDLDDALDPLVIALDVGSTACRGAIHDAAGRPVGKRAKIAHAFTTDARGTSTIDPDQVVDELGQILDDLARRDIAGRVGGVALDTFASSLIGVDGSGQALTPCFTYADSRCAAEVQEMRQEFDETEVQQRTGVRLHTSYLAPRLRWLARTQPDVVAKVERWLSLGEYVHLRLLGTTAAGTATAAWSGLLDRRAAQWDEPMLEAAGITVDRLSEIRHPDSPLRPVSATVDARWPSLADVPWFPAVPDGLASNLGAGAFDERTVVAGASTSGAMRVLVRDVPDKLPSGLWCYRVDAERSLLGGALNDVGRALTWVKENLDLETAAGESSADDALDARLRGAPDTATPLVLPFFTGERSTGWAADARATFTGVTVATDALDLARGVVEGVALSYRRVFDQLAAVAGDVDEVRVSGRVHGEAPGILEVLADAVDTRMLPVTIKRSTLHGTALLALEQIAPDVERAEVDLGPWAEPNPEHAGYFDERLAAFEKLYGAVVR